MITAVPAKVTKIQLISNSHTRRSLYIFMKILNLYMKCKIRKRMRKLGNVIVAS